MTTGAAGSNVVITDTGTASAAVFNFTIPKGDTGATGPGNAYKSGVPASKTSSGSVGQIAIDGAAGILYVCVATNSWQKVNLSNQNFSNAGGFL